jgi:hypothetical protein
MFLFQNLAIQETAAIRLLKFPLSGAASRRVHEVKASQIVTCAHALESA